MSRRPSWLPNGEQELLLEVAIAKDYAKAARSWRQWNRRTSLEAIDHRSFNLLPLVYRNLTRLDIGGEDVDRLRGVYRYTWSRNQLLMRTGARAIAALDAAGIRTMVLKGGAVTLLQFGDLGVRPMFDFDLLVPRDEALAAFAELRSVGFRPSDDFPVPEVRVPVHHSTSFVDSDDRELDLHWNSLWQPAPDDDFWDAAVPIRIADRDSLALCPTDQLLHVCSHGTHWADPGGLGWIPDSARIISGGSGQLDWKRFCEVSTARRLAASIHAPLTYLRERFEIGVPREVLSGLRQERESLIEWAATRKGGVSNSPMRVTLMLLDRYRRLKRLDPEAPRPSSFPAYMRTWLGYDSYADFSLDAGRRLVGIRRAGASPD